MQPVARSCLALVLLAVLDAGCAMDMGDAMRTCLEHEGEVDPFATSLSGAVVSDEGFERTTAVCLKPEEETVAGAVTLQTLDGRARFSWMHKDLADAPFVAGEVVLTEVATEFNGNTSLAMSDADGLVAVFAPVGSFAPTTPGIVVAHDAVRSIGTSACGSYEVTALRVTTAESDVLLDVGESKAITVDDVPFTFHAFASARATSWSCTDGGPRQSWAAFRDP